MKNIKNLIILSFLIILIFPGCKNKTAEEENTPRKVIPENGNNVSSEKMGSNDLRQHYIEETISPKINIDNPGLIIYIQNVNLDFDTEEEQVIVLKDAEKKNTLDLIVLDFDSVRNKYITTWETVQEQINPRTFIISYADTVGDHNLEIIFKGTGTNNEQILDIYRKTHSPTGIRLYYENIAKMEIEGQIEIVEKERSSAYLLGQKNGVSFPIITYESDDESGNLLDMVKKTFIWNYQSSRFIKAFEEKIPGEKIEEDRLKKLFNEGIDAYKDFLQGQWVNIESKDSIISFDKNNNEFSLYSNDILEIYKWTDFNRSKIPNSVYISAKNDLIHFIRTNVFVRIEKLNKIRIVVNDREFSNNISPWNGYYEKVDNDMIVSRESSDEENISLDGLYTGLNDSILFSGKNFTQEGRDGIKKGIFSVFEYNSTKILELRYLDNNRLVGERKEYMIEYNVQDLEERIVREILLQRGDIKSLFFHESGDDEIVYKQTVEKE